MFKNMKIRLKLIIGFAVVLVFLGIIAVIGLMNLAKIDGNLDELAFERFPRVVLVNQLMDNINTNRMLVRNILINRNNSEFDKKMLEEMKQNTPRISELYKRLEAGLKSEKGKALFAQIMVARQAFFETRSKILELGTTDRENEAFILLQSDFLPVEKNYMNALQAMIDHNTNRVNILAKNTSAEYDTTRTMMITLSLFAILIGLLFAFGISHSITSALNQLIQRADNLSSG